MKLPQVISGSGARYANEDESFVFWNKGDTAFVTEGTDDKMTFKDCVSGK
jgi:membrane-bound inhibitor of C-type lysozyme